MWVFGFVIPILIRTIFPLLNFDFACVKFAFLVLVDVVLLYLLSLGFKLKIEYNI